MEKKTVNETTAQATRPAYSYYSRVLEKPFDSLKELTAAEKAHYDRIAAKEEKAAQKKADAQQVEVAFKALNAARRTYKEQLATLTTAYTEGLTELKKAFETGKADIAATLEAAEQAYKIALKAFTDKYPEGYHITLRDGDFETTISSQTSASIKHTSEDTTLADLFNLMFGL